MLAYQRVVKNKGAAGVDGIGIAEFKEHLKQHWPTIKAKLLTGEYMPAPVRRVDIPKPQGGVRTLGIPTLTDRLIQQALHQVLSPIFEADFSESSYGFRPGRNAHQAAPRRHGSMLPKAAGSWSTWTWRNSLTASITTC
jgi:RNA-directed DNA polymerase